MEFNSCLTRKFTKRPSAQFIANHFNLINPEQHTITKETARKWMQGITIPDPNKFQILIEWLNMDINKIFTAEEKPTEIPQNFENEFYAMLEQAVQEVRLFSQKTMVKEPLIKSPRAI